MPKPVASKELRERIRKAYQSGEGTLKELAERFKVSFQAVQNWSARQGWQQQAIARELKDKVTDKLSSVIVSEAQRWVEQTKQRANRLRGDIDASREQFETDASGRVVMDVLNIKHMSQAELSVDELARRSLGIEDKTEAPVQIAVILNVPPMKIDG